MAIDSKPDVDVPEKADVHTQGTASADVHADYEDLVIFLL